MTNPYFNNPGTLTPYQRGVSATVSSIFDNVASGFALLPSPSAINSGTVGFGTDSSVTPNLVSVTQTTPPASYTDGLDVYAYAANTSTGACTIRLYSSAGAWLATVPLVLAGGGACIAGSLNAGYLFEARYQQSSNSFVLLASVSAASTVTSAANAAASAASASTSATNAATSATSASASATNAASSASSAATSAASAAASAGAIAALNSYIFGLSF